MKTHQIVSLARKILNEHGYQDIPIQATRAKTIMGQAQFRYDRFGQARPDVLKLSEPLLTRVPEEQVVDTILHEVAHFKAGLKAGHGTAWKAACRAIGAAPERLAQLEADTLRAIKEQTAKYRLTCKECSKVYHRNRLPRGKRSFAGYQCHCGGALAQKVMR